MAITSTGPTHRMSQDGWATLHWGSEANLFGLIDKRLAQFVMHKLKGTA